MTPEQFYSLDETKQAEIVRNGVHIADRQDAEHNILLYKNDDLYIEVSFDREYEAIKKIAAFSR